MEEWVWHFDSGYQLVHLMFLVTMAALSLGLGSRFSLVISLGSMENWGLGSVLRRTLRPGDEGKIHLVSRMHFMFGFVAPL